MTRLLGLLLVAFAVAIPALASADQRAPGAIIAVDYAFENPADGSDTVTIAAGETVTFGYPAGGNFHNVTFAVPPSSCTPALPDFPTGPGWQSTCRFNTPGTYSFVCGAHDFMTGTVVVTGDATATTTATATATTTATATATTTPTATATATATTTATATATTTAAPTATSTPAFTATASPTASATATATATETTTATPNATPAATAPPIATQNAGPVATPPAARGLRLAATQKGQTIKGSLTIEQASSRLKVEILRGKSRLATSTKTVRPGNASFALKIKRQTKTVKLTVKITVTPPAGAPFTATKTVTLKR